MRIPPIKDIVGKRILAVKQDNGPYDVNHYLLLDDGRTVLVLAEQDPYEYHDCSSSAREIRLREDADLWNRLWRDSKHYRDSELELY